jgi:hypothetical protein
MRFILSSLAKDSDFVFHAVMQAGKPFEVSAFYERIVRDGLTFN